MKTFVHFVWRSFKMQMAFVAVFTVVLMAIEIAYRSQQ